MTNLLTTDYATPNSDMFTFTAPDNSCTFCTALSRHDQLHYSGVYTIIIDTHATAGAFDGAEIPPPKPPR